MIGDVLRAEKKFKKLVGGETISKNLLKRLSNAESQELKGNNMLTYLSNKFSEVQVSSDRLDDLFGKSGIVYLLSTRPHTDSESNFVKLVKNKVINKATVLKEYLTSSGKDLPSGIENDVKNIKNSLLRYLKLTDDKGADVVPEGEAEVTDQLKRKNNKDVAQKMQSYRQANRLKTMVTALIYKMIDCPDKMVIKVETKTSNSGSSTKNGAEDNSNESEAEKSKRWDQGNLSKKELEEVKYNKELKAKLVRLVIPEDVEEIKFFMFSECQNLKEVIIPGSVKKIGFNAFNKCENLEKVIIEQGVKEIESSVFSGCANLKTISIPSSVEKIGSDAFKGCPKDIKILGTASDKIKDIVLEQNGFKAEQDAKRWSEGRITKEEIEDMVKGKSWRSFELIEKLKDVTKLIIPEGVTKLGSILEKAKNLKEVVIPGSVSTIKSYNFNYCENLEIVTICEGTKKIEDWAFKDLKKLHTVTIPGTVEKIEDSVFEGCTDLKSVTLGEGINSIGSATFKGCTSLPEITIPASFGVTGDEIFEGCTNLERVTIKPGAKCIGDGMFKGCTKLKEITIPGSVKYLGSVGLFDGGPGNRAFEGCTNLQKVVIEQGVTLIGHEVFKNCTNLKEITIPEGVDGIGIEAFTGCTSLSDIVIPGSVNTIGQKAFKDCSSLANVTICAGVRKRILEEAFNNCKSLKKLVIPPNNIWFVDKGAFVGCPQDMNIEGAGNEDYDIVVGIYRQIHGEAGSTAGGFFRGGFFGGFSGDDDSEPSRPPAETHYYSDFVEMFTKMEKDKDYTDESIKKLCNMVKDHSTDFDEEKKFVSIEERTELNRRIRNYGKAAAKSRNISLESSIIHNLMALGAGLTQ